LVRGAVAAAGIAAEAPDGGDLECVRGAETFGGVGGVEDGVAVGPGGFGCHVLSVAAGDEEAGAGEGGFAVGIGGGVEVCVVLWYRGILV